jgi:hypothetical protein
MAIRRIRDARTQRSVGDPVPQKRARRLVMRFFGSCALFVAALAGLMAGGSLAAPGITPAGASPAPITVHCPADNLQDAINSAAAGSTLRVDGTCTGNFFINKNLTMSGPAILDGGSVPTTFGAALNVISGTVVLNNLVIQHGVGIDNLGGGVWNSGQLTLNHSTVTHNTANAIGGVFNMGQLTLNGSTVSDNTAITGGGGGIFNCGANPGFQAFGLCTGAPGSLTLNSSIVSRNVGGSGDGGGIVNDAEAVMTLNGSIVSGNTTGGNGGGVENLGTAVITFSTVSGNSGGSGGGIMNNGTATLNLSAVSNNSSTGGAGSFAGGGGLSNTGPTTLNYSLVQGNSAAFVGGGIFAGGGPMTINHSIVTGNSAVDTGGGMIVWDGPTTVANSTFINDSDQGVPIADTLPGVLVAPTNYLGTFGNNPTFTTTHSTYR